jgi:hypothetical protein
VEDSVEHRAEDSSARSMRRSSAVSARARCRQMMWDAAKLIGALTSGMAGLLGLLIDESIELRLMSASIFAAAPATAALVLGATAVSLLGLLGIAYDLFRTHALPRIIKIALEFKQDIGRVLIWGGSRLIRFMMVLFISIAQISRSLPRRSASGLAWVSREIALEALWIKQSRRRLIDLATFIFGWPIRSSARLILRLIGQGTGLQTVSPSSMGRLAESAAHPIPGSMIVRRYS